MTRRVTVMGCVLLFAVSPVMAEVYKIVDEQGNVTYTDRQPTAESAPLDLPSLNEVGRREPPVIEAEPELAVEGEVEDVASLSELRRRFRDFRIIHPVNDYTFRGAGNPATIAWGTGEELDPGMYVVFYIDGRKRAQTQRQVISTGVLDRGRHTTYAILRDRRGKRIATADTVEFNIHREYQWINLPRLPP